MAIEPERIEAAARALKEFDLFVLEETGQWDAAAKVLLDRAFPELAAGTAWVAPMEASHAMWTFEVDGITWPASAWEALRDAHLSKGKDDDHG